MLVGFETFNKMSLINKTKGSTAASAENQLLIHPEILRDMTLDDKLICIPNDDTQNQIISCKIWTLLVYNQTIKFDKKVPKLLNQ